MKRIFIVALAAVFSFSFCSCGKKERNKVIKPNMVTPYNYSLFVNISDADTQIVQDERKVGREPKTIHIPASLNK